MKKSAIFVDFDNIYLELKKKDEQQAEYFATAPALWLKKLMDDERKLLVRRCYLNPAIFGQYRTQFILAGFEVVDCPALTAKGKSAADMRMLMDILDKLHHPTHFDEFILFSADSDFTPVLMRLREHDRETCIGHSGPISQAYRASADHVLDFQALYDEEYVADGYAPEFVPQAAMPVLSQELKHKISDFLLSTLRTSPSPIPTAKLITLLLDNFGNIATAWFGRGKVGTLLDELEMEKMGVCFDPAPPGRVYLPALHSLTSPVPHGAWTADEPDKEIVSLAHKLHKIVEVPTLSKADFRACFAFLAAQMKARTEAHTPGSLSDYSRALRDFAIEKGMTMARSAATSVLYTLNITLRSNGMTLDNPRYSAQELAEFYIRGILLRCERSRCALNEAEKAALYRWIGGADKSDAWPSAAASTLLAGALALGLRR